MVHGVSRQFLHTPVHRARLWRYGRMFLLLATRRSSGASESGGSTRVSTRVVRPRIVARDATSYRHVRAECICSVLRTREEDLDVHCPPRSGDERNGAERIRRAGHRLATANALHRTTCWPSRARIGGMLLSKDAVADVIEIVRGIDFYIPKHEIIFDAILGLYSHGEPTDVIAVTDELTQVRRDRAGPAARTTCTRSPDSCRPPPTRATTPRSSPRRPCCAGSSRRARASRRWATPARAKSLDLVNNAQAEIYGVTGGVESEDYVPLIEAVTTAIDEIEAAARPRRRDGRRARPGSPSSTR